MNCLARVLIGTKRQLKIRNNIEKFITIITFPLWIPFWLLMMATYYTYDFLEFRFFNWLEKWLDSISYYLVKWYIK